MVSTPLPIPVAAVIGAGVGLFLGGLIGSTYLSFTAHHDMQQIDPFAIFRWTADVAGARSDRVSFQPGCPARKISVANRYRGTRASSVVGCQALALTLISWPD